MQSAKLSRNRSRCRRISSLSSKDDDEISEPTLSSLSRPSTQDSKRSSYSRLSTDSGAGSLDDFNNRRNSSPDFWRDSIGRRHTAPTRKLLSPDITVDEIIRPNTVHVWGGCSPRCSLSRYAPLPAIGAQPDKYETGDFERPVPVRRQCFMGPLDIDISDTTASDDLNHNETSYLHEDEDTSHPPLFSLTVNSDSSDSDFEDESSENVQQCVSEGEECEERPRRTLIRSATFTIEKERPDVRGPFLSVAIRLPDGSRVADKFDCKETLGNVCEYAIDKSTMMDLKPQRYSVVTTDVPKRTFKDLTLSLKEAGIDDKTLLYLQVLNDSDSD